jgi:hypothetical protein
LKKGRKFCYERERGLGFWRKGRKRGEETEKGKRKKERK